MKDKFTTELVWHNCATCPPEGEFNSNLCVTNGKSVFTAKYDKGKWHDKEFDVIIPPYMLEGFWWADIIHVIGATAPIKAGE